MRLATEGVGPSFHYPYGRSVANRHQQRRLRAERCEERLLLTGDLGAVVGLSAPTIEGSGEFPLVAAASAQSVEVASYDLALELHTTRESVQPGETLIYEIVVTNQGPSAATNLEVVQSLPAGATFQPTLSTPGVSADASQLNYVIDTLANGEAVTVRVAVTVDPSTTGELTSFAVVGGPGETSQADNSASSRVAIAETPRSIGGVVYNDLNRNGVRDGSLDVSAGAEIVLVLDRSGSMSDPLGDGSGVTRLRAAIDGILAFNQRLIDEGFGEAVSIGVVVFDTEASILDLDPFTPGVQALVRPNADANGDGLLDLNAVLAGVTAGANTNFAPALRAALNTFNETDPEAERTVVLVSDGEPTDTALLSDAAAAVREAGVTVRAFGVGSGASLASLRLLDPNAAIFTTDTRLTAAFAGLLSVGGFVEPALANWVVYLDQNGDGVRQASEPSTRTDSAGAYAFQGLGPDAYEVRVEVPAGWEAINPIDSARRVDLSLAGAAADRDFGVAMEPAAPTVEPTPVPAPTPTPVVITPPVVAPVPTVFLLIPPSNPIAVAETPSVFGSSSEAIDTADRAVTGESTRVEASAYRYGRGIDEVDYDLIFESLIDFQRPDLLPIGLGDEAPEEASESSSDQDRPPEESPASEFSADTAPARTDAPTTASDASQRISPLGWMAYGEDASGRSPVPMTWFGTLMAGLVGLTSRERLLRFGRSLHARQRR